MISNSKSELTQKTNSNLEFRKIKSLNFLYEVNSNGTIFRNVKSKKQLLIKLDKHHSDKGYYCTFVHLGGRKNPKIKRIMIHKVVAECWLGDKPKGMEIDHIDRNSHNNDYRNLRYVTHSEQMKNRDYSNIAKQGSENLRIAREQRMKPVRIIGNNIIKDFCSYSECANYMSKYYNKPKSTIMDRLKKQRKHIYDFDLIYLNAETIHDNSTE
jgi:hypothetical protein